MDAARADSLAASADPKALDALRNRGGDPAVARAVAGQFGSFLMQGMMQDADGSAMSMAGGTGGAAVSSMFASAMSRYAMSSDKLGLADTIYRSMAAKGGSKPDTPQPASGPPTAAAARTATSAGPTAQGGGIPLGPYWQLGGHRPFGPPIGHFAAPAGQTAPGHPADAAAAVHPATDARASTGSTAAPRAAPSASQPPASFPWPHLRVLGRDLIGQPPTPPETPHAAPVAASAAEPKSDPSFPWNILHRIVRDLIGSPSSAVNESHDHSSHMTAAVGGAAPASAPRGHDVPIHAEEVLDMPERGSTGQAPPHRTAGNERNSNLARVEGFADELAPALNQASARLGVSPRVLLAQAALETGWGHSVVGNNIFGIKAGSAWHGATVSANTHEMERGRLVARRDAFRSYATVADAVDDYVTLVTASHRYRAAIGSGDNAAAYGHVLAAGGYASDRDYAAKLAAVADSSAMSYAVGAAEDAAADQRLLAHG